MYSLLAAQSINSFYTSTNSMKTEPYFPNAKNYMYEDYIPVYLTIGIGVGNVANEQKAFKKGTYNIEIEGKIVGSIDYLALGLGGNINIFPQFDYDTKESDITINSLSSELILYTQKYKGLFFSASLNYPIEIDDSDYFDAITLVPARSTVKRKKIWTPSYSIGFAFETLNGMREVSLSYKHLKYQNDYRYLDRSSGLNFYRTDVLSFLQIQLSFRASPYKVF